LSPTRRGDNTYANYTEANRVFWRQTVIPLVQRTASGLSRWLGPLLQASTFLTDDKKRAVVDYR
jgi:phage portal protein BeeE